VAATHRFLSAAEVEGLSLLKVANKTNSKQQKLKP
jgi:hypothetical protein